MNKDVLLIVSSSNANKYSNAVSKYDQIIKNNKNTHALSPVPLPCPLTRRMAHGDSGHSIHMSFSSYRSYNMYVDEPRSNLRKRIARPMWGGYVISVDISCTRLEEF